MELNKIYQGHVIDVLKGMPEQSVDCVITSPPYWSLRDYKVEPQVWDGLEDCQHEWGEYQIKAEGYTERKRWQHGESRGSNPNGWSTGIQQGAFCRHCNAWRGSLGLEPTMELFLDHLLQVFDEVRRVLKDTGTMFVNIGDSYSGTRSYQVDGTKQVAGSQPKHQPSATDSGIPAKSLCGIPERFAIAMTDRGWIRRNTLVWHKPNPMPSSATDRFTVDFEPVYFFTKQGKYWFERQFEQLSDATLKDGRMERGNRGTKGEYGAADGACGFNPQGRNKRCVWTIPTFPFPGSHFATFPPKLVEPMILSGCPEFVCSECGVARSKVLERVGTNDIRPGGYSNTKWHDKSDESGFNAWDGFQPGKIPIMETTGLTDCGCGAPFNPGVVMDIFMGAGTVGVVAQQHRRNWVGVELNPEYIEMAEKRIAAPKNSQINLL